MDTKPLERFATWARQELLTAVEAQATAVLKTDSVARTERAHAVRALEAEINRHGREHVIDKVAYTWFNRIIALRFMDARGYTDTGVVSPAQGQPHGQPEILADAKRGSIDTDVITSRRTVDAIIGFLDGTRRSTDAEGEAYALMLTAYCSYWHGSMPFMFEHEDSYIELLVPANLLADGAILSRATAVLTEDVCDDVEVIGWLYQFYISERKDEVFAGFKKNQKADANEIPAATQLFTPHWIVRYLVENSLGRLWMLNHPHSQLIDQMDYYVAPVDEETDFLKINGPEELTVIDPACGSGHMLSYAFDLLYMIYEEEGYAPSEIPGLILSHNLYGTEIDPRAGALAAFALTMKARAKQRTFFNKQVEPNVCVLEPISFKSDELDFLVTRSGDRHKEVAFWNQFTEADTLGSLIQPDKTVEARLTNHLSSLSDGGDLFKSDVLYRAERIIVQSRFLTQKYSIVITNPPYMGIRNMSAPIKSWIKENYPDERQDLYACFITRSDELVLPLGYIAMITGDTWMTIKSFEQLRRRLLSQHAFLSFVHMHDVSNHPDIFGANAAFVISKEGHAETRGTYVYLDASSPGLKAQHLRDAVQGKAPERVFLTRSAQFEEVPGMPIAYSLPMAARAAFASLPSLGELADPKVGMQTANNAKYLRFWWEVSNSDLLFTPEQKPKWLFYLKGGAFRRWWGNLDYIFHFNGDPTYVLNQPNATVLPLERASQPKVTWTDFTSGAFSSRLSPAGTFHDISGHCFYPPKGEELWVLGYSNSRIFQMFLHTLNSTIHAQVGDVARIPVTAFDKQIVGKLAEQAVIISKNDFDRSETSPDFSFLELFEEGRNSSLPLQICDLKQRWATEVKKLRAIEAEINELTDPMNISDHVPIDAGHIPSLNVNPEYLFGGKKSDAEKSELMVRDYITRLISYAVGCMFGRYSLDTPGLIIADQDTTLKDYLEKVVTPTFTPDEDNVIPIIDGDWFEDDIVDRLRQFLRVAFGEEHFEENLRFVEESLGVKTLRDYFITKTGRSKFYDDHVQRYKKRPIYWMFSSPKGSFNALIYMHRYTPSTVSTVLNEYLREYRGKLEIALQNVDREAAGGRSSKAQKEADRIRKVLVELTEYEHDVLYPLATKQVVIDLDDGVKVNYPKFGTALKKIKGLEAPE